MINYIIKVSNRDTKKLLLSEPKVQLKDALKLLKLLALSLNLSKYEVLLELVDTDA